MRDKADDCRGAFLLALRLAAAPAAPGNLLAMPGNAKVTVTWNAVTGATSYNVYRSLTHSEIDTAPVGVGEAAIQADTAPMRIGGTPIGIGMTPMRAGGTPMGIGEASIEIGMARSRTT